MTGSDDSIEAMVGLHLVHLRISPSPTLGAVVLTVRHEGAVLIDAVLTIDSTLDLAMRLVAAAADLKRGGDRG
jgi:hypothetical protein